MRQGHTFVHCGSLTAVSLSLEHQCTLGSLQVIHHHVSTVEGRHHVGGVTTVEVHWCGNPMFCTQTHKHCFFPSCGPPVSPLVSHPSPPPHLCLCWKCWCRGFSPLGSTVWLFRLLSRTGGDSWCHCRPIPKRHLCAPPTSQRGRWDLIGQVDMEFKKLTWLCYTIIVFLCLKNSCVYRRCRRGLRLSWGCSTTGWWRRCLHWNTAHHSRSSPTITLDPWVTERGARSR